MKSGAIKQIYKTFIPLLPSDWEFTQGDFFRRHGDWLQIVAFQSSRFSDKCEPRTCMEYLKFPGEVMGGFLGEGLKTDRHKVQRWVSLKELERDPRSIYQDMLRQFRPRLDAPVNVTEVKQMLQLRPKAYPHLYALCVMAAELGGIDEAKHWHGEFLRLLADSPYDWAVEARNNLQKVMDLMETPEALKEHLQSVIASKLAKAKLSDLPDLAVKR